MRALALLACLPLAACATAQQREQVDLPAVKIVAEPQGPDGLEVYDAETLFNRGQDLLDGNACEDAASYFERVVEEFPESHLVRASHYNRGLCYLELEDGTRALEAFDAFLALVPEESDSDVHRRWSLNGRFKKGAALALLERYDEVAELFDLMLVEELETRDHIEALTDSGIGHFMRGDRITAEYRFMKARRLWKQASRVDRLSAKYHVAQATFYLAEVARLEFEAYELKVPTAAELADRDAEVVAPDDDATAATATDATDDDDTEASETDKPAPETVAVRADPTAEERAAAHGDDDTEDRTYAVERLLGTQLEEKCQRLIRAQVAFLRVIREGHTGWASAAGYKVGTMYEDLYAEMTTLPAPEDLTDEQRALFRKVLRERIVILLEKAVRTWEATAEMATRTGTDNEWVEKTRASLHRVRELVARRAGAETEPS